MGQLVNGVWQDTPRPDSGPFRRDGPAFSISPSAFQAMAAPGRFQLIVSPACPWCHYVTMIHGLLDLANEIEIVELDPIMGANGWQFPRPFIMKDKVEARFAHQVYAGTDPNFSGRATVPILYDRLLGAIVSNDSENIGELLSAWPGKAALDPPHLALQTLKEDIYRGLANKVYQIGFSASQDEYDRDVTLLFESLARYESGMRERDYIAGNQVTTADLRLLAFLLRFDDVYFIHFKCSLRLIREMPALSAYVTRLLADPRLNQTYDREQILRHYYQSHLHINPTGRIAATTGPGATALLAEVTA